MFETNQTDKRKKKYSFPLHIHTTCRDAAFINGKERMMFILSLENYFICDSMECINLSKEGRKTCRL